MSLTQSCGFPYIPSSVIPTLTVSHPGHHSPGRRGLDGTAFGAHQSGASFTPDSYYWANQGMPLFTWTNMLPSRPFANQGSKRLVAETRSPTWCCRMLPLCQWASTGLGELVHMLSSLPEELPRVCVLVLDWVTSAFSGVSKEKCEWGFQ